MNLINRWMPVALKAAEKSNHRVKIGGVLLKNGRLLNIGWNKVGKTHPRSKWYIHCELDCLLGIKRQDLNGAVLVLARKNSLEVLQNCKPCSDCQNLLKEVGIDRIYYTSGIHCLAFSELQWSVLTL